MPEVTEKTELPADPLQKRQRRIHLPAWLGRPGAEFLVRIAVTALAVWLLLTFVIGVHICHSQTGQPMIKDGDLFVSFRLSAPSRGDVVVYRHDGEISFGRVLGLSGEQVEITSQAVLTDGFRQPDSEGYDTGISRGSSSQGKSFVCTVPQDCVFILNDNRSDLSDSRTWGSVPLSDCEGPVVFLIRRRGF